MTDTSSTSTPTSVVWRTKSWRILLHVPEGVSAAELPVLGQLERLRDVFNEYFQWRADLHRKHGDFLQLIGCTQALGPQAKQPLFPKQPGKYTALLTGQSRNLATQRALVYGGHSGGEDSIGPWHVYPLGMLCAVYVVAPDCRANTLWEWNDAEPVRIREVAVVQVPSSQARRHNFSTRVLQNKQARAMELHKVEAFASWFEQRIDAACTSLPVHERRRWKPFAAGLERYLRADHPRLTTLQKRVLRKMYGPKVHRGFLLHGPAGTGKSLTIRELLDLLRMHCVWGYTEDDKPVVGTGAALKGGLQGDLEMRIYALFQRTTAAPWLPTAITVDEIDFTAPSRQSVGSQESGSNLWLEQLSDGVRPTHVCTFGTTNEPKNVLEQLVDRLDSVYVGLLEWENAGAVIRLAAEHHWPAGHFPVKGDMHLGRDHRRRAIPPVAYYHAMMLGMTPRAVVNLRTPADVAEVQLASNPWPTLTRGPVSFQRLLAPGTRLLAVQADCGALLRFLLWAQQTNVLSGRVLVDTTRLKEGLITVEVELVHVRAAFSDHSLLFVDAEGRGHSHATDRRGTGRTFTRAFVLQEQADELGLWAVLARFALCIHATHCSFLSNQFLRSMSGSSTAGADERNRASLATAIQQYVTNCERGVTVLPLRHARIQQPEQDGISSSINAHEVWDLVTAGWRCNESKHQLFVVVASEQWEMNALLASSTIAWQSNEYRSHVVEREEEEQCCQVSRCGREFSTRSFRDGAGCAHAGKVVRYAPPRWESSAVRTEAQMRAEMQTSPDIGLRAKWTCCGKPFLEAGCPNRRHEPPQRFEEATENRAGGLRHRDVANRWWCNYCCNVVSARGCTPEQKGPPAAAATSSTASP
jgi:ATPase family associated with various cellular activities (AAA)